jgi:site-specific DNA-cytosine methylase
MSVITEINKKARNHTESSHKIGHVFKDIGDLDKAGPDSVGHEYCLICGPGCKWLSGVHRSSEDLLSGGLPCTPFSTIGPKRWDSKKAMTEEHPWWAGPLGGFVRHINLTRPRWVSLENVAEGMLKRRAGAEENDLKKIIDFIIQNTEGYQDFEIFEFDALMATSMRRKRVFVTFTRLGRNVLDRLIKFVECVKARYMQLEKAKLEAYMAHESDALIQKILIPMEASTGTELFAPTVEFCRPKSSLTSVPVQATSLIIISARHSWGARHD